MSDFLSLTRLRRWLIGPLWILLLVSAGWAAEVIPPAPKNHFNDYAGVVPAAKVRTLNEELTAFERETSTQLVVAIYPTMQSPSSIEDYTVRVAQAWGVGTKERKNGAVLFVFTGERKLYIQVGYGLEGVLPDALCRRIIANEIVPHLKTGDYPGGLAAGTRALMSAARGEYRGKGRTVADQRRGGGGGSMGGVGLFIGFIILATVFSSITRRMRGTVYHRGGRGSVWIDTGRSGGGWWGGGGGGSSGGGGSFSGGGGSFGGGGAGGSW